MAINTTLDRGINRSCRHGACIYPTIQLSAIYPAHLDKELKTERKKRRIFKNDNVLNGTFFSDSTINGLIGLETDFHFVFIVSPVSSSLDLKRTFTLYVP